MRTCVLLLLAALVHGCCVLTPMAAPFTVSGRSEIYRESLAVKSRRFELVVSFASPSEAPWLIQEIRSSAGYTVVEAFRMNRGQSCGLDTHWSETPETREMLVYPGDIADYDAGRSFAMLEENLTGLRTTTGPRFNEEFRKKHGIAGRVTRAELEYASRWTLVFDGVSVTLTGVKAK